MKAIIHGLQYDTDKATLIGEANSGPSESDLYLWSAGLYRTPCAGRYFLAGYGGTLHPLARQQLRRQRHYPA